ncbi:inositol monophosphatase [Micromonospora sp. DR5-3]|uniref:inositol monophosphatase family protein n=1 Tax=unclassified Micromonospora TaxID=2617518 RepID=UPI0011D5BC2A|nr:MULTISPECIES: inositol monophosphatase family protein [unclassified Micromonospora]MCW3819650.1 inositol monophosphatase [Micromonospora sp. DR5-3]TYC12613.1 inositol monophosphatase [Micromonospora sp. MP36]
MNPAELLPVAVEATTVAAELVRTRFPGTLTAKGDRDMASEVDFAVERAVRDLLRERTPGIGLLGEEEGGPALDGELTWVLDPVDGTVNFVHGLPLCAVSLALVRRRRPVLGVVEMPFLGSRYQAVEGAGAYADGRRLRASAATTLAEAVVAVGDYAVGADADLLNRERLAVTAALVPRVQRIRMLGTAATDLAWVAGGRLDALVMLANNPWDTAAGVVLAREAGALVVDRYGAEHDTASNETLAGPRSLLDEIRALIRAVRADFTE